MEPVVVKGAELSAVFRDRDGFVVLALRDGREVRMDERAVRYVAWRAWRR